MTNEKICPFMSTGHPDFTHGDHQMVKCQENKCRLWIEVFTTELHRIQGCAYELQPQMVDGQLRV